MLCFGYSPAVVLAIAGYKTVSDFDFFNGTIRNENSKSESKTVARPGFEPRQTVPKTVVLPLYYQAIRILKKECKNKG